MCNDTVGPPLKMSPMRGFLMAFRTAFSKPRVPQTRSFYTVRIHTRSRTVYYVPLTDIDSRARATSSVNNFSRSARSR